MQKFWCNHEFKTNLISSLTVSSFKNKYLKRTIYFKQFHLLLVLLLFLQEALLQELFLVLQLLLISAIMPTDRLRKFNNCTGAVMHNVKERSFMQHRRYHIFLGLMAAVVSISLSACSSTGVVRRNQADEWHKD